MNLERVDVMHSLSLNRQATLSFPKIQLLSTNTNYRVRSTFGGHCKWSSCVDSVELESESVYQAVRERVRDTLFSL